MAWVDESRRNAFERKVRWQQAFARTIRSLDNLLPTEIVTRSLRIGNELILPYQDALAAIRIAAEHRIAVLGFDAGEIKEDGFQVVDYSGYDRDVPRTSDWRAYVAAINSCAEDWMKTHHYGYNHGYILTSASEGELLEAHREVERE